ncbi:Type II secretion system protein F [Marinomonas spartinae]|uniref:General secretion pathway protein F n=1 Tax=Marinomonas spartinae TaxID=1792290 RepID=A0A1A8TVS9_9GAMM|nr:type II secretion system F family protein [Marinomonas spartinae]SBS35253.1 Type II secretion system protein F [Marinomonas spartinae]SBS37926.1 Type II secretion system protein F [Marinomonas spartinae]
MAAYEYFAINQIGKKQKGVLEAESERHLRKKLSDKQLTLIRCKQGKESHAADWFSPKISIKERALLTRQLATLIEAGLPIEEAIAGVARQSKKKKLVSMLIAIRSKVLEGNSLASSLASYPRAFPAIFRASIKAGEESGFLSSVLVELANFSERTRNNQQKLRMAMLYPVILTLVAIAIVIFLLGSVMPDIVMAFQRQNAELPGITLFMLQLSHLITGYGKAFLVCLVITIAGYKLAMKRPSFRIARDVLMLRLPVLRSAVKIIQITRYISTLAMLVHSGVSLVDAMNIAAQVTENHLIKTRLSEARQKVKEGVALGTALEATDLMPPMMLQLVISGEQSGELDAMLLKASKQQEDDTNSLISTAVGLFEPAMLLVMGAVVMLIVCAILLPIMNLNQLLG